MDTEADGIPDHARGERRKFWRWPAIGIAAAGTALVLALVLFLHAPAAKAGENGTFANDCCGTVELRDGKMLLADQQTVGYSVARDAAGPYILPRTYVGVIPYQGFDVDGTRSVRRLRLDRLPAPTSITIYEASSPYRFTRQPPRPLRE